MSSIASREGTDALLCHCGVSRAIGSASTIVRFLEVECSISFYFSFFTTACELSLMFILTPPQTVLMQSCMHAYICVAQITVHTACVFNQSALGICVQSTLCAGIGCSHLYPRLTRYTHSCLTGVTHSLAQPPRMQAWAAHARHPRLHGLLPRGPCALRLRLAVQNPRCVHKVGGYTAVRWGIFVSPL